MFRVLFGLPWPVMAVIAAGLFWLAQQSSQWVAQHEAEKAEALMTGAPEPVALDAFTAADVGLADEVHVTAWVNTDHNYELTKERKGTDTVRRMFVLFGPGDGPESKVARGVVVLPPAQVDAFVGMVVQNIVDEGDPRMVFRLNGAKESRADLSGMVDDALKERGLMKDADFLVVEPYLEGREVALAADPDAPARNATMIGGAGMVAALLALMKFVSARRRKQKAEGSVWADSPLPVRPGAMGTAAAPLQPQAAATPAMTLPPEGGAWSPLEAVKAKQAALAGAPAQAEGGPVSQGASGGRSGSVLGRLVAAGGMMRKLTLAVGLYLLVYAGFSGLNVLPVGQMGQITSDMAAMSGMSDAPLAEMAEAEPALAARVEDAGLGQSLPQVGDPEPMPKDQVALDIEAGMSPADAVRKAITEDPAFAEEESGPAFVSVPTPETVAEQGVMERIGGILDKGLGGIDPSALLAAAMGGGLWQGQIGIAVLVALGSALAAIGGLAVARRARRRAVPLRRDPWDRISDRLR